MQPEGMRARGGGADAARGEGWGEDGSGLRVLFLCTGNSCRSQIAQGWARALKAGVIRAESAGTRPQGLNPFAVRVMAEVGVDITGQESKHVDSLLGREFDCVVTVCGSAREACPAFPGGTRVVHVGFDDPPALAQGAKNEEEALGHYRRVRDEIRAFVEGLPGSLGLPAHGRRDYERGLR